MIDGLPVLNLLDLDLILSQPVLKGASIGACVTDSEGRILFQRNGRNRFIPASNEKIFSVLYALDRFGPEKKWETKIWREGDKLVVQTLADPSLTLSQLRNVRSQIGNSQIQKVEIFRYFEPSFGPAWEWDDLPWYYAAKTTSFSADDAAFDAYIKNGRVEKLAPELRVKVIRKASGSKKVRFDLKSNTLTVTGNWGNTRTKMGSFAQADPEGTASRALGGDPQIASFLPSRMADVSVTGKSMREMAAWTLKESDNMYAERLLCLSGIDQPILEGPYPRVANRMKDYFVGRAGLDEDEFYPVDGSGLSRHNSVSPLAICQVLNWANRREYRLDWLQSMAAGGQGTLKNRLKDSSFIGKTGTMSAVVCLSGYVKSSHGELLTVSLLFNNVSASSNEARKVQDQFVRALEQGFETHAVSSTSNQLSKKPLPNESTCSSHVHWIF